MMRRVASGGVTVLAGVGCLLLPALAMGAAGPRSGPVGGAGSGGPGATAHRVAAQPEAPRIEREFPGVLRLGADADGHRRVSLFGRPMTGGPTPGHAAAAWLDAHGPTEFGITADELVASRVSDVSSGRFTVYAYEQTMEGVPVQDGRARVIVRNEGAEHRVVLATAELIPPAPLADAVIDGEAALLQIRGNAARAHLDVWMAPEMVVVYDEALGQARRAWKLTGATSSLVGHDAAAFYVDAADGRLLRTDDLVHDRAIDGTVTGWGTPGAGADTPSNPPVPMGMPELLVTINGQAGESVGLTDADGNFVLPYGGTNTVTLASDLGIDGLWVSIENELIGGDAMVTTGQGSQFNDAELVFNFPSVGHRTAEVNAYIHTTRMHEFIRSRAPTFTGLDMKIPAIVNIPDTCNAFFHPVFLVIGFFQEGGGCRNSAFSSVVAHEYGHFIVNRLNLAQGAFGEGFADTCSMLMYDESIIGVDFWQDGRFVRHPAEAGVVYPCDRDDSVHYCGQILGGVWWRIRENLGRTYGSEAGLELTRDLFVDWALITAGGQGWNSAHPTTAAEVLTVDDDDGDFTTGTPNYDDICAAFAEFAIECPIPPPPPAPEPFSLMAPANGAERVLMTPPTFSWTAAPLAQTYLLELSLTDGFESPMMTMEVEGTTVKLSPGGFLGLSRREIFWRVTAANGPSTTASTPEASSFVFTQFGDLNGDGCVDANDLGMLLSRYASFHEPADLTGDTFVDGSDLGLLLIAYGQGCQ